jgi:hypothetical protein
METNRLVDNGSKLQNDRIVITRQQMRELVRYQIWRTYVDKCDNHINIVELNRLNEALQNDQCLDRPQYSCQSLPTWHCHDQPLFDHPSPCSSKPWPRLATWWHHFVKQSPLAVTVTSASSFSFFRSYSPGGSSTIRYKQSVLYREKSQ